MRKTLLVSIVTTILLIAGSALADFMNLDFESYSGAGNDLLPGWERGAGNYTWPLVGQYPVSAAGLGLVTTNGPYPPGSSFAAVSGEYSLFLCPGHEAGLPGSACTVSISQTAEVPLSASFIDFTINGLWADTYAFRLGSYDLLANAPSILPDGNLRFRTDISALAGQTAILTFSATDTEAVWNTIDDIAFVAIPEPSTLVLCVLSIALLALRKLPGLHPAPCGKPARTLPEGAAPFLTSPATPSPLPLGL